MDSIIMWKTMHDMTFFMDQDVGDKNNFDKYVKKDYVWNTKDMAMQGWKMRVR